MVEGREEDDKLYSAAAGFTGDLFSCLISGDVGSSSVSESLGALLEGEMVWEGSLGGLEGLSLVDWFACGDGESEDLGDGDFLAGETESRGGDEVVSDTVC